MNYADNDDIYNEIVRIGQGKFHGRADLSDRLHGYLCSSSRQGLGFH
jgi:hypothetical protein